MRNKIFAFNLLLSFSSLFAVDKSYKILSTEIQTSINRDGTIDFTESREFSFNGDFSYVFQDIPKRGYDKIFDIQVFENEDDVDKPKYAMWGGDEEMSDIIRKVYNNDFEELPKSLKSQLEKSGKNNLEEHQ